MACQVFWQHLFLHHKYSQYSTVILTYLHLFALNFAILHCLFMGSVLWVGTVFPFVGRGLLDRPALGR
jgi:hypothetical protein